MHDDLHTPDYRFRPGQALLGAQMLFVAFGALVLVPLLTGLDPNVALCTAGLGTLLFQAITRGKVPVFLASSFAFVAPIVAGIQAYGMQATLGGLMGAGLMYVILAALARAFGVGVLHRLLPPIVTGPVIMVIGLILAPTAVHMAMGRTGDGVTQIVPTGTALPLATLTLAVTVLAALLGRGWLRMVPILTGLAVGFLVALPLGLVDFSPVAEARWIAPPPFVLPTFRWDAVLFMLPVALAPAVEHFGDVITIGSVTGRDYLEDPGIHRTLLGDGLATSLAALLGGPPNTTYSEVTGAVAVTRAFNPAIMTWAAIAAIVLAFVGKLGALLRTVPGPVMGGILILLFGAIAVVGLQILVRAGRDLTTPRNLAVVAVILVTGTGGMAIEAGGVTLSGIGLAGLVGVLANLILPGERAATAAGDRPAP